MDEDFYRIVYKSPIGNIIIEGSDKFIYNVAFSDTKEKIQQSSSAPLLKICADQLQEYFAGTRKKFTIPFKFEGTEFQENVWKELNRVKFGHLVSYEEVAVKIKNKKVVRAIGNAVGRNQIAIIVPCHRVIGKHGALTGYAGGLWRKQWLIEHEQYFLLNLNQ